MTYVMVTGPMGAGKSTFMRSLPKPWNDFITPKNVPDMLLDHACNLKNLMLYEIDAPTATGKVWIDWLKVADIQVVVANGKNKPDNNFIELWDYLEKKTPNTKKIIILNRTKKISEQWSTYDNNEIFCIGNGEKINEETALAPKSDIRAVLDYINRNYE
tara:strand:+ start:279 stop:755 length:477 start_codon:yes stop_codon:yes gene_type:complete